MCRNEKFTERGIVRRDGYGCERWRLETDFAVRIPAELGDLGVLLEPASVLAKAWEQIDRISQRAFFLRGACWSQAPARSGCWRACSACSAGYEVHVVDLATEGPKRDLVEALGAHYHAGDAADLDAERGRRDRVHRAGRGGRSAAQRTVNGGIMCLTGIMNVDPQLDLDATAMNRCHGDAQPAAVRHRQRRSAPLGAGRRCARTADAAWLRAMITRRVPLARWTDALERRSDDIKVVVDLEK